MNIKNSIQTITAVLLLSMAVFVAQVVAQSSTAKQANQSAAAEKTLTGVIGDTMCGKTHMAKDKSPAECTRMCVKQGQKYALVIGQKVYILQGHEDDLDKLAGQRVTVKGTVSGDTVNVASVTAAKKKPAA